VLLIVPSVEPDETVILIAVETVRVLTAPLPSVELLKFSDVGFNVTVSALAATEAVIGCMGAVVFAETIEFAVTVLLNVVAPVTVPPVNGKAPEIEVRLKTSMTTVSPAVQGLASVTVVPFVAV
jgi:hypothetical protein